MKYLLLIFTMWIIGCMINDNLAAPNITPECKTAVPFDSLRYNLIRLSGCDYISSNLNGLSWTGKCPGIENADSLDTPVIYNWRITWIGEQQYIITEYGAIAQHPGRY